MIAFNKHFLPSDSKQIGSRSACPQTLLSCARFTLSKPWLRLSLLKSVTLYLHSLLRKHREIILSPFFLRLYTIYVNHRLLKPILSWLNGPFLFHHILNIHFSLWHRKPSRMYG